MGDVGDYWNDHKEYVRRKKYGRSRGSYKPYVCDCGKKFEARESLEQHCKAKDHTSEYLTEIAVDEIFLF